MKKIGLVVAMDKEFGLLRGLMSGGRDVSCQGLEFFEGKIGGKDVVLARSGMGKVCAAVGVLELIKNFAPDCVINTGVAGGIGTLLAAFGLLNAFQGFLSLMSALIPPLAGVLIAAYWIVGKGKKENFEVHPGFSAVGVISFAVGAIFACITGGTFASFPGLVEALPFLNWPFFVGSVNGIVVSLVLYVILAKAFPAKNK